MAQYKLVDAIEFPLTINVATRSHGYTKYGQMRLAPGKIYELPEDDAPLVNSLRNAKLKKTYTSSLEESLKKFNVPYEIKMCPSCGGRVKKIEYHVVEIIE